MKVKDFLELPLIINKDEDGIWVAESPIFNGFFTQGYDLKELQNNIQEVSEMYFDMIKDGEKPYKANYFINLKYNKDGKITNDFSKEINKSIEQKMIGA